MRPLAFWLTFAILCVPRLCLPGEPLRHVGELPLHGDLGSDPAYMTVAGDFCYFAIYDTAINKYKLWRTDGTADGTIQISVTDGFVQPWQMVAGPDGWLYFIVKNYFTNTTLQATDGVQTKLISTWSSKPFATPPPASLVATEDYVYCQGQGVGLPPFYMPYTPIVKSLNGVSVSSWGTSNIYNLLPAANKLYLATSTALYESNETASPRYVCDFAPTKLLPLGSYLAAKTSSTFRVIDPVIGSYTEFPVNAMEIVAFNDKVYLIQSGTNNLWKAEMVGESASVSLLSDLYFLSTRIASTADALFLVCNDGIHGYELWKLDKQEQLVLVKDIVPGTDNGGILQLIPFGDGVAFVRKNGDRVELWTSNGTEDGTKRIRDVGAYVTSQINLAASMDTLFLVGEDEYGAEPWKSDGTEGGTGQIVNLETSGDPRVHGIYPGPEGEILFGAGCKDKLYLARTDATLEGTRIVTEMGPRPSYNEYTAEYDFFSSEPSHPSASGVYVTHRYQLPSPTYSYQETLLHYNPADQTGKLLASWNRTSTYDNRTMRTIGDAFYIVESSTDEIGDLYMYNAPTNISKHFDTNPSGDSKCGILGRIDTRIYLSASDGVNGSELWRSNGSTTGTFMVKDIAPSGNGIGLNLQFNPPISAQIGNFIYFAGYTPESGSELWRTNGSEQGTVLLKDLNSGSASSSPSGFSAVGGKSVFMAYTPEYGNELFVSDGTAGGTKLLKDIVAGSSSSTPAFFYQHNGLAYYIKTSGTRELWRTDGTEAGTLKLASLGSSYDIKVLGTAGNRVHVSLMNQAAYFGNGWLSTDGSAAGTVLLGTKTPSMGIAVNDEMFCLIDSKVYRSAGTASARQVPNLPPIDRLLGCIGNELVFCNKTADGSVDLWAFNANAGAGARDWKDYH